MINKTFEAVDYENESSEKRPIHHSYLPDRDLFVRLQPRESWCRIDTHAHCANAFGNSYTHGSAACPHHHARSNSHAHAITHANT